MLYSLDLTSQASTYTNLASSPREKHNKQYIVWQRTSIYMGLIDLEVHMGTPTYILSFNTILLSSHHVWDGKYVNGQKTKYQFMKECSHLRVLMLRIK